MQTETIVRLPIINPDTGKGSHYKFMGKVDRIEGTRLIDWKGVGNPARFIAQLRIGYQCELYALACFATGTQIDEVEYRLITRPTIRLCGKDKSRNAYEERCVEWLTSDPQRLTMHNYVLSHDKMKQARWYLWESSRRIIDNKRCNRWLPNIHACYAWERECQYMELCDAVQNGADYQWMTQERYRRVSTSHPELDGKDDWRTLTYSSLSDLTLCEMIYYWKHVQRLKKGREEESEALWTGSALHAGMEVIDSGESEALDAIDEWAFGNPVLGNDGARLQDQQIARARAMVRAACAKWNCG